MTMQDRLEDISKRSGLSVAVVRRVLNAQQASLVDSLKRGEDALIRGICTLKPTQGQRFGIGGKAEDCIYVKAKVSTSLKTDLENTAGFIEPEDEEESFELPKGIRTIQVGGLG